MGICGAVLAAFCFSAVVARADDRAKKKPATTVPSKEKAKKEDTALITGSNIPQKIGKDKRIPASSSPVEVIDRQLIDRSGAMTLSGVLNKSAWR